MTRAVAFLKFTRDRRGYEHHCLVEPVPLNRRGRGRPRTLYWFRTPPHVKVGREAFDPDLRQMLERRYPEVRFDWLAILGTPIPAPVEVEPWRERRRAERAARQADLQADETTPAPSPAEPAAVPPSERPAPDAVAQTTGGDSSSDPLIPAERSAGAPRTGGKRRRRGRRGRTPGAAPAVVQETGPSSDGASES